MTVRTKLRKIVKGSIDDPLKVYFQILTCRDDYPERPTNVVTTSVVDKHYLLMRAYISPTSIEGYESKPFGIIELDKPEEAIKRMYEEGKRFGKKEAKSYEREFVDLVEEGE